MNDSVNVYKPQEDKDAITATPAAIAYIQSQIASKGSGLGIRLSVKKAGCSGYKYVIDLVVTPDPEDKVFPLNDELAIYVDPVSYQKVRGTNIDYVQEGLNKVFKYRNPNEQGSCGCGESFTV